MVEYAYTVVLEPEAEGGFTVSVPALPGCFSEGDSREEAITNIREAIALYLETLQEDGRPIPGNAPLVETVRIVA